MGLSRSELYVLPGPWNSAQFTHAASVCSGTAAHLIFFLVCQCFFVSQCTYCRGSIVFLCVYNLLLPTKLSLSLWGGFFQCTFKTTLWIMFYFVWQINHLDVHLFSFLNTVFRSITDFRVSVVIIDDELLHSACSNRSQAEVTNILSCLGLSLEW